MTLKNKSVDFCECINYHILCEGKRKDVIMCRPELADRQNNKEILEKKALI